MIIFTRVGVSGTGQSRECATLNATSCWKTIPIQKKTFRTVRQNNVTIIIMKCIEAKKYKHLVRFPFWNLYQTTSNASQLNIGRCLRTTKKHQHIKVHCTYTTS